MPTTTPYYTTNDIIASVKRKIAFPISQVTFTENDIIKFANEEMFIAQVPSVLQYHEEYFVTYSIVPLKTNLSKYPIPNRATGMKLRDLFWQDQNGNLFELTRIEEHDKAFFQSNIGANQAVHKFYIEGNDVVLTPGVVNSPTGSLVFVFYLRPNQLVKNGRAAIIEGFNQTITINNSLITPLDTVTIGSNIFTAVNTLGGTITNIQPYSSNQVIVTSTGHQLSSSQTVTISGSNCNPNINGSHVVQVLDANTFLISTKVLVPGNAGSFTSPNQFQISVSDVGTAGVLASAINASNFILGASAPAETVNLLFSDIYTQITTSNQYGFLIPSDTIGIQFESLPSSYTDQETNVTDTLFVDGALVDLLQTNPGHRTYVYDVEIPISGISGTSVFFPKESLRIPTGTVNLSAGASQTPQDDPVQYTLAPLRIGDYMCLANESIIPQIPPDLHTGLAERTAARILAALGDREGLQASLQKISEIEQRQGTLLDNRSEGTPQKVVNRNSMLRYGKMGTFRRV